MTSGVLVLAATPIGQVGDAPPRLAAELAGADVIAAEDTRRLKRLTSELGITLGGRVVSYFEGNEAARTPVLVEALLALARAEPDANAAKEEVDLRALLADCVAAHAPLAERGGIDLGFEHAQPATVTADADSLRVMFGNLLDNAIKYTPAGGRVDVTLSAGPDGRGACVQIADSGPGIPAEERARVFDRFYRDAQARVRTDVSGSGLGLAIVKRVAAQHGAEVELGDAPLGGLLVTVRL